MYQNDTLPDNQQAPEAPEVQESLENRLEDPNAAPEPAPAPVKQGPDPKESFNQLRKKSQALERERDEALRRLQEIEAAKQPAAEPDDDLNMQPDALAEGKHLNQMAKKIRKLEQQLKEQGAKTQESVVEARIKAQYPDFDNIVSKENIDQLRYQYPELAQTLNTSSDLYSKAVSAYTLIKKLGITPEGDPYAADNARAQANLAKPRPLVSGAARPQGDGALSQANAFANGLTDDLKKQLWKEMQNSSR